MSWPRISPEDSGELSAGKVGSSTGVDISNLWFVFRRPSSTPACPPAQARKTPAPRRDSTVVLRQGGPRACGMKLSANPALA